MEEVEVEVEEVPKKQTPSLLDIFSANGLPPQVNVEACYGKRNLTGNWIFEIYMNKEIVYLPFFCIPAKILIFETEKASDIVQNQICYSFPFFCKMLLVRLLLGSLFMCDNPVMLLVLA